MTEHAVVVAGAGPAGMMLAAELAGLGSAAICATVFFCSFPELSALSARFASGTTPAATAVPPSETKSAITATTSAGLGRSVLRRIVAPSVG